MINMKMINKRKYDKETVRMLFELGEDILTSEGVMPLYEFLHHRNTTLFEHVAGVSYMSLRMAMRLEQWFGVEVDRRSLVRAAILHDYFLYDWHERRLHRLHGFSHALVAYHNARKLYHLNEIEADAILRHMFPLTVKPPRFIEGLIICIADKICATVENLRSYRYAMLTQMLRGYGALPA